MLMLTLPREDLCYWFVKAEMMLFCMCFKWMTAESKTHLSTHSCWGSSRCMWGVCDMGCMQCGVCAMWGACNVGCVQCGVHAMWWQADGMQVSEEEKTHCIAVVHLAAQHCVEYILLLLCEMQQCDPHACLV